MTQLQLFNEESIMKESKTLSEIAIDNANNWVPEKEEWLKGFTFRQRVLHYFLMEYALKLNCSKVSHMEILTKLDFIYDYTDEIKRKKNAYPNAKIVFNNLTSRRELSNDLKALSLATGSLLVFTGQGYTNTAWKIQKHILKMEKKGKLAFRQKRVAQIKLERQNQYSYNFNNKRIEEYNMDIIRTNKEIEKINKLIEKFDKDHKEE